MATSLLDELAAAWPPERWVGHKTLVACSGGPDSVALAAALAEIAREKATADRAARGELAIAHVHHGLRPTADRDAETVRELAERLALRFELVRVEIPQATGRGEGLESLARTARYAALREIAARRGSRYVVTAHHAEDQAETVLFRLLRGSGESGLAGIPTRRRLGPYLTLIRPCLGISRATLRAFAEARGLPFVHDPTNEDRRFLRNRIRRELLPLLERDYFPGAVAAIGRFARDAEERAGYLAREADAYLDDHASPIEGGAAVDFSQAIQRGPLFVREVLRRLWSRHDWPRQNMSRDRWVELERRIRSAGSDVLSFPGVVRAVGSGTSWSFARAIDGTTNDE